MSAPSLQEGEYVSVFYRGRKANGFSKRLLSGGTVAYYQRGKRTEGSRNAPRERRKDITSDREAYEAAGKSAAATKKRNQAKRMRVSEFWHERFVPHAEQKLGERTFRGYSGHYRNWMEPEFGREWVRDVTEDDILQLFDRMRKTTFTKGGVKRRYSEQSVYNLQTTLSAFFQYAVDRRQRDDNPVRALPASGRVKLRAQDVVDRRSTYESEEIARLVNVTEDRRLKMMFTLAPEVGFRTSEMCGIKLECIDWERGSITVRWQLVSNSSTRIGPLKWAKEIGQKSRTVYPQPETMAKLREYVAWTKRQPWSFKNKEGWLYPTRTGNAVTACWVANQLRFLLPKAGIERRLDFHCFRHTFASQLGDRGFNASDIGRLLGDSPDVAARVYVHFINETMFAERVRTALQAAYGERHLKPV